VEGLLVGIFVGARLVVGTYIVGVEDGCSVELGFPVGKGVGSIVTNSSGPLASSFAPSVDSVGEPCVVTTTTAMIPMSATTNIPISIFPFVPILDGCLYVPAGGDGTTGASMASIPSSTFIPLFLVF